MPRHARTLSPSGIYHAISRGINKTIIFEEPGDYSMFLEIVKKCKEAIGFKVLAYCLMNNHYHIVIDIPDNRPDIIFKKINTSYACYFNSKYERTGHLFQDRFHSEPILNEIQLIRTIAYIHRNPVKAGICTKIEDYMFSSYNDILWRRGRIVSPDVLDEYFCSELNYIHLNSSDDDTPVLDIDTIGRKRITDEKACDIVKDVYSRSGVKDLGNVSKNERDLILIELKHKLLSIDQISRVTGVSRNIVARAGQK